MTHWFEVFRFELRQTMRRKGYLFLTFGVPLLALVAFFGYQFYQEATESDDDTPSTPITEMNEDAKNAGYVDQTAEGLFPAPESYAEVDCTIAAGEAETLNAAELTDARSTLIKRISSPYCLRQAIAYYETYEDGERALKNGDLDALYVIEPDYVDTGDVSVYIDGFSIEAAESESLINDFLIRSLLHNLDPADYEALYLRLRDPAVVNEQRITGAGEATEADSDEENFVTVYAFGLTMMLSMFWGGGYLMQSAVREKESRIVEIIISSVRPTALFMGKILAMGLLAMFQIILLVGVLVYIGGRAGDVVSGLSDIDVKLTTLVLLAVYFVLGFLLFGSLMAALGAISTSIRESQNLVVFVSLPAAIPFFFLTFFAEEPNSTLATTLSMIPFTAPLSMIMRVTVTDVPPGEIALSLGLLVLGVAAAIWLAGRLFRVNTLLSGQMPRLQDIPKLLRF